MRRSSGKVRALCAWLVFMVIVSCASNAESDDERLKKDQSAGVELNRINESLASSRPVTKVDVDALVRLRQQYAGSTTVRQLLQSALIKRQDWEAALELLASVPESQRSSSDKLNLAKIYLKLGRFREANDFLKTLQSTGPERTEVVALRGQAEYYSGSVDASVNTLESIRAELIAQKRADELAILGTGYSRRGEHAKAVEILSNAVEVSPENASAHNALSRAYAASGDTERAEATRAKLESLNERAAAEEKRKLRLVPLMYQLERAYESKNHDEVIAVVASLLPVADSNTKAVLYQYLATAHRAKGNETDAKSALAEAEKLSRK